jgi:putative transposase
MLPSLTLSIPRYALRIPNSDPLAPRARCRSGRTPTPLRRDTDQINGMAFLRTHLEPALRPAKFQPQAQDNVLREKDRKRNAFAKVCFYIAANPVRAKLLPETGAWPYTGSVVPGFPKLNPMEEDFWPKFWRIRSKLLQSDVDKIKRPSI